MKLYFSFPHTLISKKHWTKIKVLTEKNSQELLRKTLQQPVDVKRILLNLSAWVGGIKDKNFSVSQMTNTHRKIIFRSVKWVCVM